MSTTSPNTAPPQRLQPGKRRPAVPLTDDQYLASSLALVATLSRRVRGAPHRPGEHGRSIFCSMGSMSS